MSRREGIGVGTIILVIVSLLVVVVGASGVYLAMTNQLDGFLAGFGIVKSGEEEPVDDDVFQFLPALQTPLAFREHLLTHVSNIGQFRAVSPLCCPR